MADDIRGMTAQLAADPDSLVFVDLAEALRNRGQLDAAYKVVRTGLTRYPQLGRARHVCARILCDRGEPDRAFEEWVTALRLDPGLVGAHQGLGFLYYQAGDLASAERHLAYAAGADPADQGTRAALERVRAAANGRGAAGSAPAAAPGNAAPPAGPVAMPDADRPESDKALPFAFEEEERRSAVEDVVFAGLEGRADGLLLVDVNGLRLGGGLRTASGEDAADAAAAQLAGAAREAERTARLLALGAWRSVAVECADANLLLTAPAPGALLLTARGAEMPMGRLARFAERASAAARAWLEQAR